MFRFLCLSVAACLLAVSCAHASRQWNVADFGVDAQTQDCVPALTRILQQAKEKGGAVTINFPKGTYHFYPDKAQEHKLYVSNHDQPVAHRVGVPLVGMKNVTINANGSCFVFHGDMLPVLVQDSEGVTCKGFSISYATPFSAEGRIVDYKKGVATMEFDPKVNPPWTIEHNHFVLNGENGKHKPKSAIVFQENGMIVPTGKAGDIFWTATAWRISPTAMQCLINVPAMGYKVGDTVVLRNETRPHAAMVLYRATDTVLKDVVFHDSQGMALIAQRSTNIRIKGGGCLCAEGRVHSVSADACHFSNCRGEIVVENATFEGMMDDAINVHATSLRIEGISPDRHSVTLRYCHRQAFGFETFAPSENLRYIDAETLEEQVQTAKVQKVDMLSPTHVQLTLETPVPGNIHVGDAVENADWHPSVVFRNNTVRNNRARGALFTTPKPVLVEGNKFIHSSGSAILLAGDAAGWYESGACANVIIRNNVFDHNLTCLYQFTNGIISICPEVANPERQKTRYHRNIRIEGNTFRTHRVPLLYAISADGVIMQNNTVVYDDLYRPIFDGTPYLIEHCDNMQLQKL